MILFYTGYLESVSSQHCFSAEALSSGFGFKFGPCLSILFAM